MEANGRKKASYSLLLQKNKLMAERRFLLMKLAECANQIKKIDEQLKSI